jgi:hypothetical protein
MKPAFDINGAEFVEFGVGLDERKNERFTFVPVDPTVQAVLKQMAIVTQSFSSGWIVRENQKAFEASARLGLRVAPDYPARRQATGKSPSSSATRSFPPPRARPESIVSSV